jgi:peroxiredoxin
VRFYGKSILLLFLVWPWLAVAAPDFALPDETGKPRHVGEFIGHGRWTVVTVWSADCPICRRDIYHMTFFHDEHTKKKDATVLGVSIDGEAGRKKALEFIDEQALNFPNLIGMPDDILKFGLRRFVGTPTYLIFSPDGKIAGGHVGGATQEQIERLIESYKLDQKVKPKS